MLYGCFSIQAVGLDKEGQLCFAMLSGKELPALRAARTDGCMRRKQRYIAGALAPGRLVHPWGMLAGQMAVQALRWRGGLSGRPLNSGFNACLLNIDDSRCNLYSPKDRCLLNSQEMSDSNTSGCDGGEGDMGFWGNPAKAMCNAAVLS